MIKTGFAPSSDVRQFRFHATEISGRPSCLVCLANESYIAEVELQSIREHKPLVD